MLCEFLRNFGWIFLGVKSTLFSEKALKTANSTSYKYLLSIY